MGNNHLMLGYVHEIPDVVDKTLRENEEAIRELAEQVQREKIEKLFLIGMGSSYTAGVMALPLLWNHARFKSFVFPSTELMLHMRDMVDNKSLVVAVSRSGERGWVIDALKQSLASGAMGLAITGTADSLLAQNAPRVLVTKEGPEITFTKTKSVACCAAIIMRLALGLADQSDPAVQAKLAFLQAIPRHLTNVIETAEPQIGVLFPGFLERNLVMIGGTGSNYGTALEAALILQEAADVPATGMDTGNLLHGPWGSAAKKWLNVLMVTRRDSELCRGTLKLAGELGWERLCVAPEDIDLKGASEHVVTIPDYGDELLAAMSYLTPMQLLTYYWCAAQGLDPDAPPGMGAMRHAMVPEGRKEPEFRE